MAEEKESKPERQCNQMDCVLNWLKVVDDWKVGGYQNQFPRLYYVVAGLVVLALLI